MTIDRIKPDPVPAVHPLWEYKADGELRNTYEAYKSSLQIPWVGVVTMAYAHYRTFFDTWWNALEPVVASQAYVDAAIGLRERVEADITRLNPPSITGRLRELGYSARELAEIRDMMDVITHGNFMQIPAVFAARLLLEGETLGNALDTGPKAQPHQPQTTTPFILMEPHHSLDDLKTIYDDVKDVLGLPFVNTDYRCFARWPSYFQMAWNDLRGPLQTPEYEAFVTDMHNAIATTTKGLANPNGLTPDILAASVEKDASAKEVLETVRLFSWLLPGLVTNVAFFRAQLL